MLASCKVRALVAPSSTAPSARCCTVGADMKPQAHSCKSLSLKWLGGAAANPPGLDELELEGAAAAALQPLRLVLSLFLGGMLGPLSKQGSRVWGS
eukprot:10869426-Alexandrium_andersonii.AAC.1